MNREPGLQASKPTDLRSSPPYCACCSKDQQQTTDGMKILDDIRAMALPTQVCGLLPFFSGENEENFRLGRWGRWYGRGVAALLLVSSALLCQDVLFASQEYRLVAGSLGDTEEINRTIETLFCICSYTMMVLSSVHNASKHWGTLRDVARIDEYLEANGFRESYSCRLPGALVAATSTSVVLVAFYYVHFLSGIGARRQCVLMLVYSLQMLYSGVFAVYLRTVLKSLALRIEFLNRRLDAFTRQEGPGGRRSDRENWRELSNLIEVFCKLRYITENMNSVAGVGLLFFFGFAFYTVTNQSYLAFSTLTARSSSEHADLADTMGLSCAWVLAETVTMAVICSSCDCLASAANTTSQILARVYGKSKEFQNIIDKFLTKSIKQEVQFTAYGFFAIDNSTLFKIFSAVTTYLVILVQFKQLEDSKVEEVEV
ncbi:gustatory receptor 68a [Drosophila pseudoobscura]|uniref:Gustatory receptor n=1 Tax=Drosophila pseudoobscura pseudoobscura TaxID=46245 RepID=A0A6I8WD28_DROPS|nr:gustatory receptor 68a [Drosophila pseudoobscura]